jgi:hypothetical protein
VAVVVSPIVAVCISTYLQDRKERRNQKLAILGTLIATRHMPISDEVVRALNMIDIIFYDKKEIRKLWREYFEMLSNAGLNNQIGANQRGLKNLELIHAMAKSLGYGVAITHLDVNRIYSPIGLEEKAAFDQELSKEFMRVLKATDSLSVMPRNDSSNDLGIGQTAATTERL